jgi:gliding motility-associated-like protein
VQPTNPPAICSASGVATFTASVTGTSPTYQWKENGIDITNGGIYSGATSATLTINGPAASMNGNLYSLVVTNTCGTATSTNAMLTVNTPVAITTQPTSPAALCSGAGNAVFNISATGTGLTYQWRENGVNLANGGAYSGATTSTLTITNPTSSMNGNTYEVLVSGTCGALTSNSANIIVNPSTVITTQASPVTLCTGAGNANYSVSATGTSLSYQWRENGVNLSNGGVYSGVNSSSLVINSPGSSLNNKSYDVVISGTCGNVTSNAALLSINTPPNITVQPVSPAMLCSGSGNASFTVSSTGTSLSYQWRENGVNITNGGVYSGATSSTLTLTNPTDNLNGKSYDVVVSGTCGSATSTTAVVTINSNTTITAQPIAPSPLCAGTGSVNITANATGTNLSYQWQENGINISNGGFYAGANTSTLTLTSPTASFNGNNYSLVISGTCGIVSTNTVPLVVNTTTTITVDPTNPPAVCEGSGNAVFSVSASGSSLSYQWRENNVNISNGGIYSGASTPTLTITNPPSNLDGKNYDVLISGTCGAVTSSVAQISVNPETVAGALSGGSTICEGSTSMPLTLSGSTGGVVSWESSVAPFTTWNSISHTGTSYTSPALSQTTRFRAIVQSGVCTPQTSSFTEVTVTPGSVTPGSVSGGSSICDGNTSGLLTLAGHSGGIVRWESSIDPFSAWSPIANTGNTYTSNALSETTRFRAIITSGGCAEASSLETTVIVNKAPVISSQPATPLPSCAGSGSVTFSVIASGSSLTYQWRENGVNVVNSGLYSGATSATLTLTNPPYSLNSKSYDVVVTATCGNVTSQAAVLTVNPITAITSDPTAPSPVCSGAGNAVFNVTASGTGLTYQWRENGTNISNGGIYSGVNSSSLSLSNPPSALNGKTYDVVVSGTCGNVVSAAPILTVNTAPIITTNPSSPAALCEGSSNVIFNVNASGTGITYQWRENGSNLTNSGAYSGVTTSGLTIINPSINLNDKNYDVVVTGSCGTVTSLAGKLLVNPATAITSQPTSPATQCSQSGNLALNVAATGTNLTYQWKENGVNLSDGGSYSGSTSASLTIINPDFSFNNRNYEVMVSGTCSNVLSNQVTITINPATAITAQPVSPSAICPGAGIANFNVAANGIGLTYQWKENGSNISDGGIYSGVNSNNLKITNPPVSLDGKIYTVTIVGTCGTVISSSSTISISNNPVITTQPSNPASICASSGTILLDVVASGTGLSYQWRQNGSALTNGGLYAGVTTTQLTITNPPASFNGNSVDVLVTGTCGSILSFPITISIDNAPTITSQPTNPSPVCEGAGNATFNISASGSGLTYQWRENGVAISNSANYTGVNSSSLTVINPNIAMNGKSYDVIITGTCGNQTSSAGLLAVRPSTAISSNPATTAICANDNVTFNVVATGANLTYQWRENGNALVDGGKYAGTTTATLSLANVPALDNMKSYDVIISGTCGGGTSNAAILTVNTSPTIVNHPTSPAPICDGNGNTSFSVSASGTGLTYQWKEDGVNITNSATYSGVNAATLIINNPALSLNNKKYSVLVTGTCGNVSSTDGILTINSYPTISVQPIEPAPSCANSTTINLNVSATGSGVTYQWRENGANITDGGVYSGASSSALTITNPSFSLNNRIYDVIVKGTCGSTNSSKVNLLLNDAPSITAQPLTSAPVCSGNNDVSFNISATGAGLSYQWKENGIALSNGGIYSGTDSPMLTISKPTSTMDGNNYTVTVTGTCGVTTSTSASLVINDLTNISSNPTTSPAICPGTADAVFSVSASGTNLTYQWLEDGQALSDNTVYSGTNTSTLTLNKPGEAFNKKSYLVLVTGACGPLSSSSAELLINSNPVMIKQPSTPLPFCTGTGNVTIDAEATGTGVSYQWQENENNIIDGAAYAGATTSTLTILNPGTSLDGKKYRVLVNATCKNIFSNSVDLTVKESAAISAHPSSPTPICEGGNLSFSVAASGTALTYQWKEDGIDIQDGGNYAGANSPILNLTNIPATNGGKLYTVQVSNTCNSKLSNAGVSSIKPIPATPLVENNGPLCDGGSLELTTTSTADSYSWNGPSAFVSTEKNPMISNVSLAESGNYKLAVTVNGCTSSFGQTNVVINPIPATPLAQNNGPKCEGSSAMVTTSSIANASYKWTGPQGFTSTSKDITIPSSTQGNNGTYSIIAEVNGCSSAPSTTNLVINTIPATPSPINDGPVCEGGDINLNVSPTAGVAYEWSGPNNYTNNGPSIFLNNIQQVEQGSYSVVAVQNGCTSPSAATLVNVQIPQNIADAGADQLGLCQIVTTLNGNAPITGSGSGLWSIKSGTNGNISDPTQTTTSFSGTDNELYTLTWTLPDGLCPSTSDDVLIKINQAPSPAIAGLDQLMVCGTQATLNASTPSSGAGKWEIIDGNGGTLADSQNAKAILTGGEGNTYSLKWVVSASSSCPSNSDELIVSFSPTPTGDAGQDQIIKFGKTAMLNATGGKAYQWLASTSLSSLTSASPIAKPGITTTYAVSIFNEYGCSIVDSVTVEVIQPIKIPNTITPNGDSDNETWVIQNILNYPNAKISIYNRWGQVIRKLVYNSAWDGKLENGTDAEVGTYFYVIDLQDPDYTPYAGSISIVK